MILGVGCDITAIQRFEKNCDELAIRILTKKEQEYYFRYPAQRRKEFLAGRFAAKEAVIKALDQKRLLSEIEILSDAMGKPVCSIMGYRIHLSISHEKEYAMAYVICEKGE